MRAHFVRSRWAAAAIASLLGACGRIGYENDLRGDPSDTVGSSGSYVVGTGAAGTPVLVGDQTSTGVSTQGAGGTGADGDASPSLGGASGATDATSSTTGSATVAGSTGAGGAADSSSGAGTGGAGGAGGMDTGGSAVTDAGQDVGPSASCDDTAPVAVYYRRLNLTSQVRFAFKVANLSNRSIPLRDIKTRYFLTNERSERNASIQYGDICCPDNNILNRVSVAVVSMASPAAKADTYLEVSFDALAGNLDANHSVEVEVTFGTSGADQSDDYSYIASATAAQTQWDTCPYSTSCRSLRSCAMTVLVGGALVWGDPP